MRLAATLALVLGLAALACGGCNLGLMWLSSSSAQARLRPIGAAELARTAAGSRALVEGRLPRDCPARRVRTTDGQEATLAAFERSTAVLPGGEEADWEFARTPAERVTPPLVLEVPDGRFRLEGGYGFRFPPRRLRDWEMGPDALLFEGFSPGDVVVAEGIVVDDGAGRALRAEQIDGRSFGDRQEFHAFADRVASGLGYLLLIGGLLLTVSGVAGLMWSRPACKDGAT